MWLKLVILVAFITVQLSYIRSDNSQLTYKKDLDVRNNLDNLTLLFKTISGSLLAIDQHTGNIKWKNDDEPAVIVPMGPTDNVVPLIVPDPKERSLYLLDGTSNEYLKKLPFSISELAFSCPSRSSDGVLFTGVKSDTWYWLDVDTGEQRCILEHKMQQDFRSVPEKNGIYLGRTKYDIKVIDSKNSKRYWNMTFFDYSSVPMNAQMLHNYEYVHFTSSTTGIIKTYRRETGQFVWSVNLRSPITSAYFLHADGLISLPFSTVANFTFSNMSELNKCKTEYLKTLYVGEHSHGLYAISTYIHQSALEDDTFKSGSFLLKADNQSYSKTTAFISSTLLVSKKTTYNYGEHNIWSNRFFDNDFIAIDDLVSLKPLLLGYYYLPEYTDRLLEFVPATSTSGSKLAASFIAGFIADNSNLSTDIFEYSKGLKIKEAGNVSFLPDQPIASVTYFGIQGLIITLLICFIIYMLWTKKRDFEKSSHNSAYFDAVLSSNTPPSTDRHIEQTKHLADGSIQVGKIIYYPNKILGKGCDGTVVYHGTFDKRQIAVKRLLSEYIKIAEREVNLLRKSDNHRNVIRYFCTERDFQFQYIALELCSYNLDEYLKKTDSELCIRPIEILEQITAGLSHLHYLRIVHRDIKPHNVLLSTNEFGLVRVMISDFGLCKILPTGEESISKASGPMGTKGWTAPEMYSDKNPSTYAVDIFSLGCLFYYLLTKGKHPFGDYDRQANICAGCYDLDHLSDDLNEDIKAKLLIEKMISHDPKLRPCSTTVKKHPMFWSKTKELIFLQDVSDRIEKLDVKSEIIEKLETNGRSVVRVDWIRHICDSVAIDLRKHRTYNGANVRDLLRALRNKKNHYQELSPDVQTSLGEIPDGFISYWTTRYPLLISHTWLSMQIVKNENIFNSYYSDNFEFNNVDTLYQTRAEDDFEIDTENMVQVTMMDRSFVKKKKKKFNPYFHRNNRSLANNNNIISNTPLIDVKKGL